MPFHFKAGEDPLDPETNARAGLAYLAEALRKANGDVAQALAGYNGGHSVIGRPGRWSAETRRYVYWGLGIYEDARRGQAQSARLQEWLEAGGRSLCEQAARRSIR
jgi:soluble lytic murein transglycosylase-like protein